MVKTKCKKCNKRILGYKAQEICDNCQMWEEWYSLNILKQKEHDFLEAISLSKKNTLNYKWKLVVGIILLVLIIWWVK